MTKKIVYSSFYSSLVLKIPFIISFLSRSPAVCLFVDTEMSKGHLWHVFIVDVVVVDVDVSINLSEKRSIQKLRCLEKDETEAEVLLFQALCFISGVRFIKLYNS